MLPLQPPINDSSEKSAIANLHEGLLILGQQVDGAEIQNHQYGDFTRRVVMRLQRELQLQETDGFIGEITARRLNQLLKEKGAFTTTGETETKFEIKGRVFTNSGVGVPKVKVMAFDKRFSGDVVLGESQTDPRGNYIITYKAIPDGKERPDIEVQALEGQRAIKVLGRSAVKYNAAALEIIDVLILSGNLKEPTEFERLLSEIQPHLGNTHLKDLVETKDNEQVSFLANKTGWDPRLIAMASQAHKLSAQTNTDPSHFYALFRAGVPGNNDGITRLTPGVVENIIKKAGEGNIIPPATNTGETIKIIQHQATQYLLNAVPAKAMSSMSAMLGLRLQAAQQNIFTETILEVDIDKTKFWSALKNKGFDEATIKALQLDGKLGYLTGQNLPLIKKVYDKYNIKSEEQLVQKGLHKTGEWKTIIGNDVPKGVTVDDYATQLANEIKLSYPTSVAAEMINANEIKLSDNGSQQEVYKFFSTNALNQTIGKQPVKTWPGFKDLSVEAKSASKKMERLYQVSPSDESMIALAKIGMNSAQQITSFTKAEFMDKYVKEFPAPEEAELTYNKATEIASTALNLATGYLTTRSTPNIYAITGDQQKARRDTILPYPTLEQLFDNMDYCACDHCKSVLGPAAYLVELLQFIDQKNITHEKQNPIDELFKRRPDLQHLQLTCENTNMALPYIDLVNEVLEHYILNGNLTTLLGHDVTEETKQSDLLAEPQFVNKLAYDELKKKVFPYHLPFDHSLEALRLLFSLWDSSLHEALGVFSTQLSSRKEVMELNEDEYKTLTDKTFKELPEFFGQAPATTIAALNTAISDGKTFSRLMNISYEELTQILKTKFINPGIGITPLLQKLTISLTDLKLYYDGTLTDAQLDAKIPAGTDATKYGGNIKQWLKDNEELIMGLITLADVGPGGDECNFAALQLRYALPDNNANQLKAIAYHKFHRFIRLLKKTGWKIETLDNILNILSPVSSQTMDETNIDATFIMILNRIANFKKMVKHLSLSDKRLNELLMLWDTTIDQSVKEEQAAKLLKLRIPDMKDLAQITGINPLTNDLENDEPSFLKLLYTTNELKAISLKILDLNYILQHKDESNKLALSEEVLLKNIKQIRDGLVATEKENSIAPDNADFAFAKNKMTLVYDPAVAENFFGLLTGTNTYSANFNTTEEGLPAKLTLADSKLGYDPFKKMLTYVGVISATSKTNLDNKADALVLADMGTITVQNDLNTFINNFKAALQQIVTESNADLVAFGNSYPELKTIYDAVITQATPAAQARTLLNGILPELILKLKLNILRQTLSSILKTDPENITALTDKKETLQSATDSSKSILFDFNNLEEKITFDSNQSYQLYVDAPATDDYLIYVRAPQNTTISLTVNGQSILSNVVVGTSEEVKNSVPLSLKAGSLIRWDLTVGNLPATSKAEISWRTKGMSRTIIPSPNVYRKEKVDAAIISLVRLQKAAQLQHLLKLTPRELVHFASQNTETKDILNGLDTKGTITTPQLNALWNKLKWMIYFSILKKENEGDENSWVQILENPSFKTPQNKNLLEEMNLWQETDLTEILTHFGLTRNDLSKLSVMKKVVHAMRIITTVGYPAAQVKTWITANPTHSLVEDIKKTIKENSTEAAWLESMPTVSDPLRNKLRDALVSYVLHYKQPSIEVNSPDKLYEHFLMDVEMDACMKTSRIRQALSTVQLFIQRCLMNLEKDVAPSSIRAHQWTWMKRYRVWEANRKIFLYPENWLEPELRDNKSSFFKELEGELLQSEITDESAELAFLNYLKKLDDVARLDIAGMYLEENEMGNQNDDILHVFGRTNGSTRQYYYRRYEYGYWTPWEKITLNIEGEYIFPVVWKKRLFVFWLNIWEQGGSADTSGISGSTEAGKISVDQAARPPLKTISISMSWGEYYKGKWTSPKSTELTSPMLLENVSNFAPANFLLYAKKEKPQNKSERLIFTLLYIDPKGFSLFSSTSTKGFNITYTSKNAPPVIDTTNVDQDLLYNVSIFNYVLYRSAYTGGAESILNYNNLFVPGKEFKNAINQPENAATTSITESLITKKNNLFNGFRILPLRHKIENQWEGPVIYSDERSTFFVQADEEVFTSLQFYDGYYFLDLYNKPSMIEKIEIPPLAEQPIPGWPKEDIKIPGFEETIKNPWEWNKNSIAKNVNITKVMPVNTNFAFGDAIFSAGGKVPDFFVENFKHESTF